MSFPSAIDIATGIASGLRSVRVPGLNTAVAQAIVPVAPGGAYRTPQPGGEQRLRIRAGGNAADTATGSGARSVRLSGLDADGAEIVETIATAGAGASALSTGAAAASAASASSAAATTASRLRIASLFGIEGGLFGSQGRFLLLKSADW